MPAARRHISLLNRPGPARGARAGYLRPPSAASTGGDEHLGDGLSHRTLHKGSHGPELHRGPPRARARMTLRVAPVLVVILLACGAVAVLVVKARVETSSTALATIALPLGGGTLEHVEVVHGPHAQRIAVSMRGDLVWPRGQLASGERVQVEATVRRPGWLSWLTGDTERVHATITTPSAAVADPYLTLPAGAPLRVAFTRPVAAIADGSADGQLARHTLNPPSSTVLLPRGAAAGSLLLAAMPRVWERSAPTAVSYFPPGTASAAVATPSPGTSIDPGSQITLTFTESVAKALGHARPALSPSTSGSWQTVGEHTIAFHPSGYGYGLGSTVTVALPAGVRMLGAPAGATASTATWTVPAGSTLRLQELLAELGYLPLNFAYRGARPGLSPQAQEAAAVHPPAGGFTWRYGDVPSALRAFWAPGTAGVMTRGAVMAFESEHNITTDGLAGPAVWRALIAAAVAGQRSSFGYTFVSVSKASQTLDLWHDGHTVLTTPVNTGISSAPTESGTYPVYEHISSGTMSGTNPDGSHYNDPGIKWISYFNGGDALHAFERAQYGFPQSLGCVEMPLSSAGRVWPYTPIGTLVHVG
ncbi:MAG: L,D-transpeptidase [Solirubrobacteraceae bacterium]